MITALCCLVFLEVWEMVKEVFAKPVPFLSFSWCILESNHTKLIGRGCSTSQHFKCYTWIHGCCDSVNVKSSLREANQHAIRARGEDSSVAFIGDNGIIDFKLSCGNEALLVDKLVPCLIPIIVHLIPLIIERISRGLSKVFPHEIKILALWFCW